MFRTCINDRVSRFDAAAEEIDLELAIFTITSEAAADVVVMREI